VIPRVVTEGVPSDAARLHALLDHEQRLREEANRVGTATMAELRATLDRMFRELTETKDFLDNILASSTEYSIIAKDLERRILSWNEGARRNYGYEAAEVVGRSSDVLHDPEELASGKVERLHRQALETGRAEGTFLRRRKDGTNFVASVVITRRNDASGAPVGYLLISKDVTKEAKAQRELEETKAFLNNILNSSTEHSIIAKDLERRILSWNEGARRNYGYEAHEVVGRSSDFLHADEDLESGIVEKLHAQALRDGMSEGYFRRRRKDGSVFTASVVITRRDDLEGKPAGYLLVSKDITREQRLQRELAEAEAFLESVLESSTAVAIVAVGLDGSIQSWNRGAEALFESSREAALGSHVKEFLAGVDVATIAERSKQAQEEWRGTGVRSGQSFPCGVTVGVRRAGDQALAGYVVFVRDLSQQLRDEERQRLQAEVARMKALDEFKTNFINMAAHELGTPLTPLRIQASLLAAGGLEPEQLQRSASIIQRSEKRLSELVRDLLDAARIQANRVRLDVKDCDFDGLVRQTLDDVRDVAAQKGVRLELEAQSGATVAADAGRLAQVVNILAGNAVKFTPAGERVVVRTRVANEHVLLEVTDTGMGFAPEAAKGLFQPFSQVHDLTAVTQKGSGLGLYIAKHFVELHGGTVSASSPGPGLGATFVVRLPLPGAVRPVRPVRGAAKAAPADPRQNG
ncbi:MAG TPA: PAS domain-containing sensor histidine kinase, partial [Candidatus Thermoplasmatota archaeon]|nr:PAS domain-containing sensor histidine kinase [Candidatus Thermoplasmatota archaeon]